MNKIDFVQFLPELYLLLSFNLDMELIFYFEKPEFLKIPAAKKVSHKKNVSDRLKLCNLLEGLQLFLSPCKETVSFYQGFFNKFLCFTVKDKQKLIFVRLLSEIYVIFSFNRNLKRIIYFDKRDFFILPVPKQVLRKKMSRVILNFAAP